MNRTTHNVYPNGEIAYFQDVDCLAEYNVPKISRVKFTKLNLPAIPTNYNSQCIAVDNDYIYRLEHLNDESETRVRKFNRYTLTEVGSGSVWSGSAFHGNSMSVIGDYLYIFEGNKIVRVNKNNLTKIATDISLSPFTDSGDIYNGENHKLMVQLLDNGFCLLIREYVNGKWVARTSIPCDTGDYYVQDMKVSENFIYKVVTYGDPLYHFDKIGYIMEESWKGDLCRIILPIIGDNDEYIEFQGLDKVDGDNKFYLSDYNGNVYISEDIYGLNRYYHKTSLFSDDRNYTKPVLVFQNGNDVTISSEHKVEKEYQLTDIANTLLVSSYIECICRAHDVTTVCPLDGFTSTINIERNVIKSGNEIVSEFVYTYNSATKRITLTGAKGFVRNIQTGAISSTWNSVEEYIPLSDTLGWVYIETIVTQPGLSNLTGVVEFNL